MRHLPWRWALAALAVAVWWAQALPSLADPPSGMHAWRETDGLIVARNACLEGRSLWEPRVSNRGDTDGRTGTELPMLNAVSAFVGCRTGDFVTPWRVLSFLGALLAALAFTVAVRRRTDEATAALAVALFASAPLVPYFSRTTQPDALALGLAMLAVALADGRAWPLAALPLAAAAAVKLPAAVWVVPVVAAWWSHRRRAVGVALGAVALVPAALWYRHARALERLHGLANFGVTRSPAQLFEEWQRPVFYESVFVQQPFDVWVFPVASVAAVVVLLWRRRLSAPSLVLGVTGVGYLFACGYSAAHHNYYGLLIVPVLAWAGAKAFRHLEARVPSTVVPAALTLLVVLAIGWQVQRTRHFWAKHRAEWAEVERFGVALGAPGTVKVVVFSDNSPQLFWFSHQHGRFGDGGEPRLVAGEVALVDRLRVPDAAALETTLRGQGCAPRFENVVLFACAAP